MSEATNVFVLVRLTAARMMEMTLHNAKASQTLCLLASLNVGNSNLHVDGKVERGCYGYATSVSRSVRWGYSVASVHLWDMRMICVGRHLIEPANGRPDSNRKAGIKVCDPRSTEHIVSNLPKYVRLAANIQSKKRGYYTTTSCEYNILLSSLWIKSESWSSAYGRIKWFIQ